MNSLTRFVGYSVLLLLVFLMAALGAQGWLRRQALLLRTEAVEARQAQFASALRLVPRAADQWDEAYRRELGGIVGGTVVLFRETAPPPPRDPALLFFDVKLADASAVPVSARVSFTAPPTSRLLAAHQRVTVALLLLAAILMAVAGVLSLLTRRAAAADTATRPPWQRTQAEMVSLAQLAKSSVEKGEALDHERDVRRRAEEDAELKQGLLDRSLEEKIGLGRDLHDGIIQSLYAVGLTLESVRGLVKSSPAEADRRLEQCCENLNSTIREVRHYITGLAPENLRRTGLVQTLDALFRELGAGSTVKFDLKVDEEASALLNLDQTTEALQIVREAVSNAIRHGRATLVTVRLHKSDQEVCLLVQDNGTGFDPAHRREGGHGLGNMHARAQRVGASTSVTSKAGEGTRVVVMLAITPLAAS
ncbi:MAG TPA: sensor histidine kinase [Opitutaceae bacterium]|nr:sensor histidine kinase [Opitutaceae bacterium]